LFFCTDIVLFFAIIICKERMVSMKILYNIPETDIILEILDKYQLQLKPEHKLDSLEHIAEFVFENCKQYLPDDITGFLKETYSKDYQLFKEGIKNHLKINLKLAYLNGKKYFIKSNHDALAKLIKNLKKLDYPVSQENNNRYLNYFYNDIGPYFDLNGVSGRSEIPIPDFASNFLLFMSIHHSLFKRHISGKLQDPNELLMFQKVYINLVDRFSKFKDVEYYLFEQTLYINLIFKIIKIAESIEINSQPLDKSKKKSVYNHLGLACLLPNICNRGETLVTIFQIEVFRLRTKQKIIKRFAPDSKDLEFYPILDSLDHMILQIALIAIPLMEMYFNYLCRSKKISEEQFLSANYFSLEDLEERNVNNNAFLLANNSIKSIIQKYNDEKLDETVETIDYYDYKDTTRDKYDRILSELPEINQHNLIHDIIKNLFVK